MSTFNDIPTNENGKKDIVSTINNSVTTENNSNKTEGNSQNTAKKN